MKGLLTFYHLSDVSIRDVLGLQDLSEQFTTDRPGFVFIEQTVRQKDFEENFVINSDLKEDRRELSLGSSLLLRETRVRYSLKESE